MHGPINVKFPNNISKWHMGFNSAFKGLINIVLIGHLCTGCPTTYQTQHFFNNSNTNDDIATRFEQECILYVRNDEECVCSAPNCWDTEQRSAS
jgi:hypothetical protein